MGRTHAYSPSHPYLGATCYWSAYREGAALCNRCTGVLECKYTDANGGRSFHNAHCTRGTIDVLVADGVFVASAYGLPSAAHGHQPNVPFGQLNAMGLFLVQDLRAPHTDTVTTSRHCHHYGKLLRGRGCVL